MMTVIQRQGVERTIVSLIISGAIEHGCKVEIDNDSYFDEDPRILQDYEEIMREVMHTDQEMIRFYKEGKRVGAVFLVYGNDGFDVINDHSANDITYKILTRAEAYALSASL
jgi:hypothetical protein